MFSIRGIEVGPDGKSATRLDEAEFLESAVAVAREWIETGCSVVTVSEDIEGEGEMRLLHLMVDATPEPVELAEAA